MGAAAIAARGIGKRYLIAHDRDPYPRLSESLVSTARAPLGWIRGRSRQDREWFWAVKDVSFEIAPGDVVGVIGRNGAGKSTLLKILARITEPTAGEVKIRGRVGSLLEVGTGFHPELTGRENIFLSGSILGMRRADIMRRFDQMVDFAGVEKFLDTPVKRYSSGMQVRLGFAVAAHLEPEILLIDEVLAVGDASFQAKCLGRLKEIGSEGRTVLFVSHSMPSIQRLCSRAILLDHGGVSFTGTTSDVVHRYMDSGAGVTTQREWGSWDDAQGDRVARLKRVTLLLNGQLAPTEIDIRLPIAVEIQYWCGDPGDLRPAANLMFFNDQGVCLFATTDATNVEWLRTKRNRGIVTSRVNIPGNLLAEGRIIVTAAVSSYDPTTVHSIERDSISFNVVDRSTGDGARANYVKDWPGVVRPMLEWTVSTELQRDAPSLPPGTSP